MSIRKCLTVGLFGVAMFSVLLSGRSQQTDQERQDFSKVTDEEFAKMAEQINLTEIELGKYAASKARKAEVQRFGQQMVNDHTTANRKLAAATKNQPAGKLDSKHQAKVEKLTGISADEFDRAYMQEMVKGHKMVADLFSHESTNGRDQNLKAYAAELLPEIHKHHDKAKQIWNASFQ